MNSITFDNPYYSIAITSGDKFSISFDDPYYSISEIGYSGTTEPPIEYDISYQAILDYATTLGIGHPSNACKAIQNQLVLDLKSAGIWGKNDLWYTLASDSTDPEFGTINWTDPTMYKCTRVNNPTYTVKKGYNARSTNPALGGYLNTNWNVLNNSVKYASNNAGLGVYIADDLQGNSYVDVGCGTVTTNRIVLDTGQVDGTKRFALSSSIATTNETVDAGTKGVWLNRKVGTTAASHSLWKNGVVFDSSGVANFTKGNVTLTISCLNTSNTTFNNFSLRHVGMLHVGDAHVGFEAMLTTIWNNYYNALELL